MILYPKLLKIPIYNFLKSGEEFKVFIAIEHMFMKWSHHLFSTILVIVEAKEIKYSLWMKILRFYLGNNS